jgi:hypothetical protein
LELKGEIEACIVDGEARKGRLNLTYPDYFFASAPKADTKSDDK